MHCLPATTHRSPANIPFHAVLTPLGRAMVKAQLGWQQSWCHCSVPWKSRERQHEFNIPGKPQQRKSTAGAAHCQGISNGDGRRDSSCPEPSGTIQPKAPQQNHLQPPTPEGHVVSPVCSHSHSRSLMQVVPLPAPHLGQRGHVALEGGQLGSPCSPATGPDAARLSGLVEQDERNTPCLSILMPSGRVSIATAVQRGRILTMGHR